MLMRGLCTHEGKQPEPPWEGLEEVGLVGGGAFGLDPGGRGRMVGNQMWPLRASL